MGMEYDPDPDLRALEAMVANLTPYLYEEALYGTLAPNLPKLTVGALLLRLQRLQGLGDSLSAPQWERLNQAQRRFEAERYEWLNHYKGKIEKELTSRLRSIRAFSSDYSDDPSKGRDNYLPVAAERTIVHYLQAEAKTQGVWSEEWASELRQVDMKLRGSLGDEQGFIWAERLQTLYPAEDFWWLYSYPKE
jgi:hypothetical protein